MKSESIINGLQNAPHRALFNALGFTREEMRRPLIGIVTVSYTHLYVSHAPPFPERGRLRSEAKTPR